MVGASPRIAMEDVQAACERRFERGLHLHRRGAVHGARLVGSTLHATVRELIGYRVRVDLSTYRFACECEYHRRNPDPCEHVAAALLWVADVDAAAAAEGPAREHVAETVDDRHFRVPLGELPAGASAAVRGVAARVEGDAALVPYGHAEELRGALAGAGVRLRFRRGPGPTAHGVAEALVSEGRAVVAFSEEDAHAEAVERLLVERFEASVQPDGYALAEGELTRLASGLLRHGLVLDVRGPDDLRLAPADPPREPPGREAHAPGDAPVLEAVGDRPVLGGELPPEAVERLGWLRWRRRPDGHLEGDAGSLPRALLTLGERGVPLRVRPTGRRHAGVRFRFNQPAAGAPVVVAFDEADAACGAAIAELAESAAAEPLPGVEPATTWVSRDEAAFGRWLLGVLQESAEALPDATLNPKPLKGVIVLLDAGCLPARMKEWRRGGGENAPVASGPLARVLRSVLGKAPEEDAAEGHVLIPSTRVTEVEEALRELGAEVQHKRLAPKGPKHRTWSPHLPEDDEGPRPRKRAPWRGRALLSAVPRLRDTVRLDPHQRAGVDFILHRDHTCLLADDMGLGKTLQAIAAAQFLPGRVLVVCPASARSVWEREIARWTLESASVLSPGDDPEKPLVERAKYVVVGYAGLRRFGDALGRIPFDLAILDESHYLKNPKSQRARHVRAALRHVRRRLILSGTPVMNHPEEIRAQLALLHPEEWGDEAWFKRRFVEPYEGGTEEVREQVLARLREYLQDVMLRREKRTALPDLPEKRFRVHRVDLVGSARAAYDGQEDAFREYLREAGDHALDAGAVAAAGKLERLKQAALAGKMRHVRRFLEEHLSAGEKVVAFTKYRDAIESLTKEFAHAGAVSLHGDTPPARRAEAVRAFQEDPGTRLFVGQIIAAGTALTLTSARHVLFLDLDWNPANHRQAMDRVHRKGQDREVTVHFFLARDTVDEDVADVLEQKGRMMDLLLEGEAREPFGLRDEQAARQEVALRVLSRADSPSNHGNQPVA